MLAHVLNIVFRPPSKMIALLPSTMSYAITSAQHGPYTQPLLKRMIALLPSTVPCANTFAQHGLYILTPVKRMIALLPTTMSYASTSAQHGPYNQPLRKTYDITTNLAVYYVIC